MGAGVDIAEAIPPGRLKRGTPAGDYALARHSTVALGGSQSDRSSCIS
eukprot:COSAG04_NODE_10956_length_741_cov_0.970405_1_plen_47_part_10